MHSAPSRMKKVPYTSMVAMRLWAKRMKSSAMSAPPTKASQGRRVRRRHSPYITGTMRMPNTVPEMRQPKPVMPNRAMPI